MQSVRYEMLPASPKAALAALLAAQALLWAEVFAWIAPKRGA